MKGYCSNSPMRCSMASTCEVVNSEGELCPKCRMALIERTGQKEYISFIIKMLLFSIIGICLFGITFYFLYFLYSIKT